MISLTLKAHLIVPLFSLVYFPTLIYSSQENFLNQEFAMVITTEPSLGVISETQSLDQTLERYFTQFESLAHSEDWNRILDLGNQVLNTPGIEKKPHDQAKILAQLTSTAFYLGDFDRASEYADRCMYLSKDFKDPTLCIRAHYLKSAVHRAHAGKNQDQTTYQLAVQEAEKALTIYQQKGADDLNLLGKIHFNLGAAHADNPKGNLDAAEKAYKQALENYNQVRSTDDLIRTQIRLGKIYLLQNKYDLTDQLIREIRPQITTKRHGMHLDYLEAQLRKQLKEVDKAIVIARNGLNHAQELNAKEDASRFLSLLQTLTPRVCFVACHGGPADHFATFAESLVQKGHQVEIHATGPALKKFQDRKIEWVKSFSLENVAEKEAAVELANRCANSHVVITDVGHPFDIPLQEALTEHAPNTSRWAYYDNPEPYVPGGYSSVAGRVMLAAERILFANAHLATDPIYHEPSKPLALSLEKRVGLGYYPIDQAEKIAKRRNSDHASVRSTFFSNQNVDDSGQQILVYSGGNNEEYFSKAFPAFLDALAEASKKQDLSNTIVVLQQHPGAKQKNRDKELVEKWTEQQAGALIPKMVVSSMSSDDTQVLADGMLYYQTSMGPQFILAGIQTIQVGHEVYKDVLVKNKLCSTATNADQLLAAIKELRSGTNKEIDREAIQQGLGIQSNWVENLEKSIETSAQRKHSSSNNWIRPYLLAAGTALAVGYLAFRLFKRVNLAKA